MALGHGVGSLFGDNVVGLIVGEVVGLTATVVITVGSVVAVLFNGLSVPVLPAAAADSFLVVVAVPLQPDEYLLAGVA